MKHVTVLALAIMLGFTMFGCEKQPVSIDMDSLNIQLQIEGFKSLRISYIRGNWYAVLNVDMEGLGDMDFSTDYGDGNPTAMGAIFGVVGRYETVSRCMKGDIK